jgi:electron transport complex protein RnfG
MIKYLKQGWLVIALGLIFGATLAGVQKKLGPMIQQNQIDEINNQIPTLVSGADASKTEVDEALSAEMGSPVRRAFDSEGKQIGWVLRAAGPGYADTIGVLIGLNVPASKITGVYVLSQKETPGLGNKIVAKSWNKQYDGKTTTSPMTVVKYGVTPHGQQIEGISGATISPTCMTNIINLAIEKFMPLQKN